MFLDRIRSLLIVSNVCTVSIEPSAVLILRQAKPLQTFRVTKYFGDGSVSADAITVLYESSGYRVERRGSCSFAVLFLKVERFVYIGFKILLR